MPVDVVAAAMRLHSAKEIARMCGEGASYRTAEDWQQGRSQPRADILITLMRKSRAIADLVLRATDPEFLKAEEARLDAEINALRAKKRGRDVGQARADVARLDMETARPAANAPGRQGRRSAARGQTDESAIGARAIASGDGRTNRKRAA